MRNNTSLSLHLIVDAIKCGAPERGEKLARQMLRSNPKSAQLMNLCAAACLQQGKAFEAKRLIKRALLSGENAVYYMNLALSEFALGDERSAEKAYRNCLRLDSENVQAANNLANILNARRMFVEAEQLYRRAIACDPSYVVAYKNLSCNLRERGHGEEALSVTSRALEICPDSIELQLELARCLDHRKKLPEAAAWYYRAESWVELQLAYRGLAEWDQLADVDSKALLHASMPMHRGVGPWGLIFIPGLSPDVHRDAAFKCAEHRWGKELAAPPLALPPDTGTCLRIGYLSSDFYDHATLHLLIGVLESHDPRRVSVQLFDYGGAREDTYTTRVAAAGIAHHNLNEMSDRAAAEFIAAHRLHILVDLKGYTNGQRLGITALRPAPVIISWLGYPGSLGNSRLADYIIGDSTVTPVEHISHFSETIALMPNCYQPNDRNRPLKSCTSRMAAGLPEQATVLCSFNQLIKLNSNEFDIWCRVLRVIPNAVLWLLDPEIEQARDNIRREALRRNVDPERVIFAPRVKQAEHLARLSLADLALDCFPCTSHTTASDALWAGVPLVTRMGQTFASRVAASLLKTHGFDDLIAADEDDYFERLMGLALDNSKRAKVRRRLEVSRLTSPLFDTARFTNDLEALYQAIWRHHLQPLEDRASIVTCY